MTNELRQIEYWNQERGHRGYDHPVVAFFAKQRVAFIRSLLDFDDVRSGLDVGCGNGFSTYYMREYVDELWAVDRSDYMLKRHPLHHEGRTCLGDALNLPFEDERFDLVYSWEVLHHIHNPLAAVREMARCSRSYVLLAEPNPLNPAQFLFALWDKDHRWVLRYRKRYLRRLCEDAELRVVEMATAGCIFPNMTPVAMMPLLKRVPYRCFLGITNWILARKK